MVVTSLRVAHPKELDKITRAKTPAFQQPRMLIVDRPITVLRLQWLAVIKQTANDAYTRSFAVCKGNGSSPAATPKIQQLTAYEAGLFS
jgi:hypothetical protein